MNTRFLSNVAPYDVASSIYWALQLGVSAQSQAGGSLVDIARHVIQRTLNPRILSYTASSDVASNIRQASLELNGTQ